MRSNPVTRNEPNEWDVFRILDVQKDGLIAGYDALRGSGSVALRRTVLIGLLVTLGLMKEAFKNACDRVPALKPAIAPYEDDLARWERMRHDVAHLFDRVFQPPRKKANDFWIPGGFQIAGYDPESDTVRTGANADCEFVVYEAIKKAFEACNAAELRAFEVKHGRTTGSHEPVEVQIKAIRERLAREA